MILRLFQTILVLAAALPVAYLVHRHGVDVPFSDQWALVRTLANWRQGEFSLGNLFGLHNEHRMLFPKLIMLPLAFATGWDTRAEMAVSVCLAAASLWVALTMLRPLMLGVGPALRLWMPFFFAATVFSLRQWENWLWGWQIQWFLSLLGVFGSCALLGRALTATNPWPWLLCAAGAATVVHFSIASGVVLWVAGSVVLVCLPRPERAKLVMAWMAAGLASSAVFFYGYVGNPGHPSPLKAFDVPFDLVKYAGSYVAGPIHAQPWPVGLGLAAFFLIASALTIAKAGAARAYLLPWIGIGLFGLGNAALTAIGRVGFGVAQGLASRYVTLALTVLLAAVVLGLFWVRLMTQAKTRMALGIVLSTILSLGVLWGSWKSLPYAANHAIRMEAARNCLLFHREAADACLTRLFPNATVLRLRVLGLEAFGWNGFTTLRERLENAVTVSLMDRAGSREWKVLPATAHSGWLDGLDTMNGVRATGWALHPAGNVGRERRVIVVSGDRVVGRAVLDIDRPDVTAAISALDIGRAGWSAPVEEWTPGGGQPPLRAYMAVTEGVLMELHGSAR